MGDTFIYGLTNPLQERIDSGPRDEAGRALGGYAGERREVDRRTAGRPGVERRREVRPSTAEGQAEANGEHIAEAQQERGIR